MRRPRDTAAITPRRSKFAATSVKVTAAAMMNKIDISTGLVDVAIMWRGLEKFVHNVG